MTIDAYQLAQRYVGIRELDGNENHPLISWWLSLCYNDGALNTPDEVPWCSAFVNGMAWELRLPRSKSAMARSWLKVGVPVPVEVAIPGFDVAVFWRGNKDAVTGHVGFFAGRERSEGGGFTWINVLGGNQGDAVSVARFPANQLLGIRRIQT